MLPSAFVLDTSAGEVFAVCFEDRARRLYGELFASPPASASAPRHYRFRLQRYSHQQPDRWTVPLDVDPSWLSRCYQPASDGGVFLPATQDSGPAR